MLHARAALDPKQGDIVDIHELPLFTLLGKTLQSNMRTSEGMPKVSGTIQSIAVTEYHVYLYDDRGHVMARFNHVKGHLRQVTRDGDELRISPPYGDGFTIS